MSNIKQDFVAQYNGNTHTFSFDRSMTIGRLRSHLMSVFQLKNCSLLGLDVDDIKLSSLDLGSSQKLIIIGPEADMREFQVAEVVYGGEYKEQKTCDNCTQLLKRVMQLTNLVFLHDHEQCQLESQQLRAEVDRLQRRAVPESGESDDIVLLRKLKQVENELMDKKQEDADNRQRIELLKSDLSRAQDEIDSLKEEKNNLLDKVNHLEEGGSQDWEAKYMVSSKKLKNYENELAQLRTDLQTTRLKLNECRQDLSQTEAKVETHKAKISELTVQLNEMDEKRAEGYGWQNKYNDLLASMGPLEKALEVAKRDLKVAQQWELKWNDKAKEARTWEKKMTKAAAELKAVKSEHSTCPSLEEYAIMKNEMKMMQDQHGKYRNDSAEAEMRMRKHDAAKELVQQMMIKPLVGVQFVGADNGVMITEVKPGTPADVAGLRKGDVVEEVNSMPTRGREEFKMSMSGVKPGDKIPFQTRRDNEVHTKILTLGAVGYTPEQVDAIRRLAAFKLSDFDILE